MASGKYPIFNRGKNPFNKNVRTPASTDKKGSVMFDENYEGIRTLAKTYTYDYYDVEDNLGYYDIEDSNTYFKNPGDDAVQVFHVNYINNQ